MLEQTLDRLSANPVAWNVLRRVVENNFRGEKEVIARELDPWREVGRRRFLDFGCGTGEFAPCFPPSCYTGIDLAKHYVEFAGKAYAGNFAVASGIALSFADASFDAALVIGVFHHMDDAMVYDSAAELYRVLKPGATLLVMEDVPPPTPWNVAGHAMHLIDRGGYIRSDSAYRALLSPFFNERRSYHMRSGICDYMVYVLERHA